MLFETYLIPDLVLEKFTDLTPEYMQKLGKKFIVSDIDNTLVTYADPEPTETVLNWLRTMEEAGIRVAFLSNNHPPRIEKFNEKLGYTAYADAGKPGVKILKKVLTELKADPSETVFLGDQLLTDAACGKQEGLFTVIVPPIKDRTDLFNKSKRLIEIPYMKKYKKLQKKRG